MILQCVIFSCIVAAVTCACPSFVTIKDKDCPGHDLTGSGTAAASATECQSICNSNPSCVSYLYEAVTKKCYPKNYKCVGSEIIASAYPPGELTYYVCGVGTCQGVTVYQDKDCGGHDLAGAGGAAATAADCQSICSANPACVSFVYTTVTKKCYTKNFKCEGSAITASPLPVGELAYYTCSSGTCSAVTTYPDKMCFSHDIGDGSGVASATLTDCQSLCKSNPACMSFEYRIDIELCYLKNYKCPVNELGMVSYPDGFIANYVCESGACQGATPYPDKDCGGHDIGVFDAATKDECQSVCSLNPVCLSFAYQSATKKCYPKNYKCVGNEITASPVPAGQLTYYACGSGTCTGVIGYLDKDCVGHDIAGISGTASTSVADCQSICGSNPACTSFVYESVTKKCYPKNYKCVGNEIITSTYPAGELAYHMCGSNACTQTARYMDKDCAGHDLAGSVGIDAATVSACQSICTANPACLSFAYTSSTKKCFPKNYKCAESEMSASPLPFYELLYYVCYPII